MYFMCVIYVIRALCFTNRRFIVFDRCTDTRLQHPAIQYNLLSRHFHSAYERGAHGRHSADSSWACSLDI